MRLAAVSNRQSARGSDPEPDILLSSRTQRNTARGGRGGDNEKRTENGSVLLPPTSYRSAKPRETSEREGAKLRPQS
ncbi:putative ATP-dependent RNA helicase DDX6 [Platysternon megacephalum]|uniref:Putative ATP-dependent RNA helicase DDX6 n=1 Tax=Platysternon megacephalum TaxID=55544 RepID=A0A4D9DPK7_9SAUR|nr:putative ATP-dependent RNA helicase DDX6 [Platysternon megacephalum]